MPTQSASSWSSTRQPHVCIVGAGVSGLRCAEVLLDAGVEVTIFEARNIVGGRVQQFKLNGRTFDLGPNWIRAVSKNPIADIAKRVGSLITDTGKTITFFNEYGCEMKDKSKTKKLHDLTLKVIGDAFRYSSVNKDIPSTRSLKDFFNEAILQQNLQFDEIKIVTQMAEQWGHFAGIPLDEQSLKYFWMESSGDGGNVFVASSYEAILERIASKAKCEAHVYLGTYVTSVSTVLQSNPPRTLVHTKGNGSPPTEYDATVVTVPLGCLQAASPKICPEPPISVRSSSRALGYGNLEKAYITFPCAFWSERASGTPPSYFEFLHPLYDPQNLDHTAISCMDLSQLPGAASQPTLMFYFHGLFADKMARELFFADYERRSPEHREFVIKRFEPYYSLLPGYNADETDCRPCAAIMTMWGYDLLAGAGSYTSLRTSRHQDQELDKCVEALRHGIPEQGIYFAGEHTAPLTALGTVAGAYLSGERAAERIVGQFNNKSGNL